MTDLYKIKAETEKLLDEFYEDMFDTCEDTEYPTEAQRQEAARQVRSEYAVKIADVFNEQEQN